MKAILNNPYRILGLLVGTRKVEEHNSIRRLRMLVDAGQDPPVSFSFPGLGKLNRSIQNIDDAISKLHLDNDRMSAALFWFYNGSHTDEPVFEALKEGDLEVVLNIWSKLTSTIDISERNASAFNNLSSLYLSGILDGTNTHEAILDRGISLKLKYLESDFFKVLKALATDATYCINKKELQLMFLNQVQSDLEKTGGDFMNNFLKILNRQEFIAKEEFLKAFVQKPIEQIEKKIEECKSKRKENIASALISGALLYEYAATNLLQIKSILGVSNLKFTSISDKAADEILQCSIEYFNHFDNAELIVGKDAKKLLVKAKTIAVGNILKQRCDENQENLQEWIDDEPERRKQRLIKEDLEFITIHLQKFESLPDTISNAKKLVTDCKPKVAKIKVLLGGSDDLYIGVSSAIVNNSQQMIVTTVNKALEAYNSISRFGASTSTLESIIRDALDLTFNLGKFDMHPNLKVHYTTNLTSLKSLASQLGLSTLSPKERLQKELSEVESNLRRVQNEVLYQGEINNANAEMSKIKEWQFMRSESEKERQISAQQSKINDLISRSAREKTSRINTLQKKINELKIQLQQID